ncbi:MAG: 50S ribosomal protein L4 [Odoribacter splanchnicus]|nr:50S ribosomal protein L4 [Odoribacter splanchnicus]
MELSVLNIAGQETGRKVELNDAIFGIQPNEHAIYLDVKQYLANNRQGTHKSKQRNEISGSTRKLKKQKGTGGARAGSIKNPEFRGGGRIFGPVPRDYSFKLNKKLKRLARKSALSVKASANAVTVVEDFSFEAPKTKEMVALINNLKVNNGKLLVVLNDINENVLLSARNLQNVDVMRVSDIATYNVMRARNLVLVESSVKGLNEMFNLN